MGTVLSSSAPTAPKFDTLLINRELIPETLVQDLEKSFKTVLYRPKNNATAEEISSADVIFGSTLPPSLVSKSQVPNLKLFQGVSAGVNHLVQLDFVKSLHDNDGITFANSSGIHVTSIGEHAVATAVVVLHKIQQQIVKASVEKRWIDAPKELGGFYVRGLRDLTFGVVGYGHIGREAARIAHDGFGAKVVVLTRTGKKSPIGGFLLPGTGDHTGSLPSAWYSTDSESSTAEFFAQVDVVLVSLPSSPATFHFIGEKALKALKGNAIVVNIGRGDTVDQERLVEALGASALDGEAEDATGSLRIAGASLDVTTPEPLPDGHPLFSLPNAIITPHSSGLSGDYFILAAEVLVKNVERLKAGKGALNGWLGKREQLGK